MSNYGEGLLKAPMTICADLVTNDVPINPAQYHFSTEFVKPHHVQDPLGAGGQLWDDSRAEETSDSDSLYAVKVIHASQHTAIGRISGAVTIGPVSTSGGKVTSLSARSKTKRRINGRTEGGEDILSGDAYTDRHTGKSRDDARHRHGDGRWNRQRDRHRWQMNAKLRIALSELGYGRC